MIVTFALQADTGNPSSLERVQYTIASVRKFLPGAHIIQLTNMDFAGVPNVDEVLRYPNEGDFIEWAFGALITLCARGGNVLQIATDVLIQADVSPVFDQDFDVAACRYPYKDRPDGAYCGDVNFIKEGGYRLFSDALRIYRMFPVRDGWDGGQVSFLAATKMTPLRVKDLDERVYCLTPKDKNENMDNAAIVHFRGHRKWWMVDYAKRLLG